jgi:hypothetical protein
MEKVPRMNFLRDVIRRLRRRFPAMDFMKNKHEDCVNFENGRCKIFHFAIDPKGTACPHFKAKKEKKTEAETTDVAGEN